MTANPTFAASLAPALPAPPAPDRPRVPVASLERFDAYRVSLAACRSCGPLAPSLGAVLKDQLLRASSSVVLNIAEGFGSTSRGVKRRHYEIARGSATECIAVLDLVAALGLASGAGEARALFTRSAMMLAKLVGRFTAGSER